MNKLFINLSNQEIFTEVLPSFGLSLLIAELYYKLGSFSLECLAFLATWYALGTLISKINPLKS